MYSDYGGVFILRNVLVVFGGNSCEHDVSVITGVLTLNSIDKDRYNPVPLYVTKNGEFISDKKLFDVSFYKKNDFKKLKRVSFKGGSRALFTIKGKKICDIYSAINCMHGINGEDGSLKGLLNYFNIPLSSPSLFQSSFAMDKEFTKIALKGIGVKTLDYIKVTKTNYVLDATAEIKKIEEKLPYPVIIKPANLGSSIGITTALNQKELKNSLNLAFNYDEKVIIERKLENFIELNCAGFRGIDGVKISEIEKPFSKNDILTFSDKYQGFKGGGEREFPANISKKLKDKIQKTTLKIYNSFDFLGVIRIDYLFYDNCLYVNEINTVPGSLAYYLFCDTIKDFSKMLTDIIECGVAVHNKYLAKQRVFKSSVLEIEGLKSKGIKTFDRKN